MIRLAKRLKDRNDNEEEIPSSPSVRDKLLAKEIVEMEEFIPAGTKLKFEDPDILHDFVLVICPEEGFWQGGKFKFHIFIGEEYNIVPPVVKCLTKLWHPNIDERGDVCLSILRLNSVDGLGWAPTRKLKDVIWGLSSLFSDLLNFDEPLNNEAAEHYHRDKEGFRKTVKEYIQKYAKR